MQTNFTDALMKRLTSPSMTNDALYNYGVNFNGEGFEPGALGTDLQMNDILANPAQYGNVNFSGFQPGQFGVNPTTDFGSAFETYAPFALGGASLIMNQIQNNKNNRRADKALASNLEQVARRNKAIDSWS